MGDMRFNSNLPKRPAEGKRASSGSNSQPANWEIRASRLSREAKRQQHRDRRPGRAPPGTPGKGP